LDSDDGPTQSLTGSVSTWKLINPKQHKVTQAREMTITLIGLAATKSPSLK